MQTAFILGGVAIGVAVIVFMSAMLAGLQANFIRRVLTSQPHIQLLPPDEVARPLRERAGRVEAAIVQRPAQRIQSIDQWQAIAADVRGRDDVTVVAPTASGSALAVRGDASRSDHGHRHGPGGLFRDRPRARLHRGRPAAARQRRHHHRHGARATISASRVGDKLNVTTAAGRRRVLTDHRHLRPRQQGREPAQHLCGACARRRACST